MEVLHHDGAQNFIPFPDAPFDFIARTAGTGAIKTTFKDFMDVMQVQP